MATYEEELRRRRERLKSKRDALKKALDDTKRMLDAYHADEIDLEQLAEKYNNAKKLIDQLTKDIANEVTELEGFIRKQRFRRWGKWWNLWIFGWIAAAVVALVELIWGLIRWLLRILENPEKVVEILDKILKALGGL